MLGISIGLWLAGSLTAGWSGEWVREIPGVVAPCGESATLVWDPRRRTLRFEDGRLDAGILADGVRDWDVEGPNVWILVDGKPNGLGQMHVERFNCDDPIEHDGTFLTDGVKGSVSFRPSVPAGATPAGRR